MQSLAVLDPLKIGWTIKDKKVIKPKPFLLLQAYLLFWLALILEFQTCSGFSVHWRNSTPEIQGEALKLYDLCWCQSPAEVLGCAGIVDEEELWALSVAGLCHQEGWGQDKVLSFTLHVTGLRFPIKAKLCFRSLSYSKHNFVPFLKNAKALSCPLWNYRGNNVRAVC